MKSSLPTKGFNGKRNRNYGNNDGYSRKRMKINNKLSKDQLSSFLSKLNNITNKHDTNKKQINSNKMNDILAYKPKNNKIQRYNAKNDYNIGKRRENNKYRDGKTPYNERKRNDRHPARIKRNPVEFRKSNNRGHGTPKTQIIKSRKPPIKKKMNYSKNMNNFKINNEYKPNKYMERNSVKFRENNRGYGTPKTQMITRRKPPINRKMNYSNSMNNIEYKENKNMERNRLVNDEQRITGESDWNNFLDNRFDDQTNDPKKWWKGEWKPPEIKTFWEQGSIGDVRNWWSLGDDKKADEILKNNKQIHFKQQVTLSKQQRIIQKDLKKYMKQEKLKNKLKKRIERGEIVDNLKPGDSAFESFFDQAFKLSDDLKSGKIKESDIIKKNQKEEEWKRLKRS